MSSVIPEARRLRLTTSFDGRSTVLLTVQDSGPGIPVQDRERIFDPFFTTKSGGTGLGLAICITVAESHGGKLRLVKSDSGGSIFELAIPVGEHHSAEQMIRSRFLETIIGRRASEPAVEPPGLTSRCLLPD